MTGSGLFTVSIASRTTIFPESHDPVHPGPGNVKSSRHNPLEYAKKLVSHFVIYKDELLNHIELRVNIPQSRRLTEEKITEIIDYFSNENPSTPYEQVKRKKEELNKIASEQEEQLIRSRYVNEKKTEFLSIASQGQRRRLLTTKLLRSWRWPKAMTAPKP